MGYEYLSPNQKALGTGAFSLAPNSVYDPSAFGASSGFGFMGVMPDASFGLAAPAAGSYPMSASRVLPTSSLAADPSFFSSIKNLMVDSGFLGSTDPITGMKTDGWGGLALGTAQSLGNAWMGMKKYGLAKDQLNFQKDAFNKNWEAQKTSINTQLEDRQRARVASNAGAYQSVGDYMKTNGIR